MTLSYIVVASVAISLISLVGALVLLSKNWSANRLTYLVSFAAGVMLTVAFLDLLPEALELSDNTELLVQLALGAVVLFFFLERFVLWFHHHDEAHGARPSAVLILIGDGVHNFIDGVAIAAAFVTSPALGVAATLAIAAHEIPQEIADLSVLLHGGLKKSKALWYNFISASTALVGAVGGYYFLGKLERALPLFLAFAAGMFIYIACSDLIPDLHKEFRREKRWLHSVPFIAGIILIGWLISALE